jgi:hypothetical protein
VKFWVKAPGVTLYPPDREHWHEHVTNDELVTYLRRADELGYDYCQIAEHVVMNHATAEEMGPRWSHSLSTAGFVLGATKRIKAVCLLIVPCHDPIELAKAISTLDFLSSGRVIPMCMVGYQPWEFELLQTPPYAERGAVMDEYMDAMIELWTAEEPRFEGRYVRFDDIVFDPKPVQKPYPPLWFGGRKHSALRRIARLGDGWLTYATPRVKFREEVEYILAQPEFEERPRPLELSLPIFEGMRHPVTHALLEPAKVSFEKDVILDQIAELAALGVTVTDANEFVGDGKLAPAGEGPPRPRSLSEALEQLQWFAEEILPEARRIEPVALV